MTILFEPLDSDYHKRSVLYHATRLSMLHDRMLMRNGASASAAMRAD